MKWFKCECGASVYFDNTGCLACGRSLGFAPELRQMLAFTLPSGQPSGAADVQSSEAEGKPGAGEVQPSEAKISNEAKINSEAKTTNEAELQPSPGAPAAPPSPGMPLVATDEQGHKHRQCANTAEGVCNWLVREDDDCPLCVACRLNETIPDLSVAENRAKWARLEAAKRRLVFTLTRLQLEVVPKSEAPDHGLAFDFKADTPSLKVFTGHDNGLITLNIDEADPVRREQARLSLNERYRTLLGHLRHESGHFYWDRLIRDDPQRRQEFRALFGDESVDYGEALKAHYAAGERQGWAGEFVSAYATAHPWEDWAETFAHYLHMVDTLETAEAFEVRLPGGRPKSNGSFDTLFAQFVDLTVVLNALNRSMGLEDAYPFAIGDGAKAKLEFVHRVVSFAARPRKADKSAAQSSHEPVDAPRTNARGLAESSGVEPAGKPDRHERHTAAPQSKANALVPRTAS